MSEEVIIEEERNVVDLNKIKVSEGNEPKGMNSDSWAKKRKRLHEIDAAFKNDKRKEQLTRNFGGLQGVSDLSKREKEQLGARWEHETSQDEKILKEKELLKRLRK